MSADNKTKCVKYDMSAETQNITFSWEELTKLFRECKSHNYTQQDFERDKTARIVALAGAAQSGNTVYKDIMEMLIQTHNSQYRPHEHVG